jgi:diguanylate cyclase (GGDEF)-like protein
VISNPPEEIQLSREALSELDIFCDVDLDAIAGFLDDLIYRRLSRDEVLMKAGELNGSVYVLLSGRLGVLADKDEELISEIRVGQLIGEISVLDKRPCSATVIALEECTLLEIDESLLWSLVRASHEFARNMLILLAERLRSIREQFGKRVEMSKATERSASLDALTGLYNRRWLDNVLPLEMSECLSKGRALSFMMLDIDHFKRYNDTWGHQAGDRVLKAVAKALRFVLRDVDYAARYGGEEFCVILPGVDLTGAQSIGQRVCDYVRQADICSESGEPLPSVTISIGVAEMGPKEIPYTLIEKADRALYRAKRGGRDRVCRDP